MKPKDNQSKSETTTERNVSITNKTVAKDTLNSRDIRLAVDVLGSLHDGHVRLERFGGLAGIEEQLVDRVVHRVSVLARRSLCASAGWLRKRLCLHVVEHVGRTALYATHALDSVRALCTLLAGIPFRAVHARCRIGARLAAVRAVLLGAVCTLWDRQCCCHLWNGHSFVVHGWHARRSEACSTDWLACQVVVLLVFELPMIGFVCG